MIKVAITGVAGRMGGRIFSLLQLEEGIEVVGVTEKKGHPDLGKDVGLILGAGKLNLRISDSIESAADEADAVIDFTSPGATLEHAQYASKSGKPMVIGTTGLSQDERGEIEKLARSFPCVISPNMSVGINILFEVSKRVAAYLGDEFDVEITEVHHRHKVDSPSGTAIRLGEEIADALGRDFKEVARFERYGQAGERKKEEIGIQAVRGGDVIGEHTVYFLGNGERIELTHRATSRDNFARGAIRAVRWVVGKPPGIYTMKDVLGI
jgi:4-hydroxy-tetrahydrodipicolinate reductase